MNETGRCNCACADKHHAHLCMLSSQEKHDEIARLTDAPTVVCFICGRNANKAENVCSPMTIP